MTEINISSDSVLSFGKGWLVVDKPAMMSVHNDPGKDLLSKTIHLLRSNSILMHAISPDFSFGLHPVHRLDKETSGLILLGCRKDAFNYFSNQFQRHEIYKSYFAVLHGKIKENLPSVNWHVWEWPLSKISGGRENPQGTGKKITSITRFRVLEYTQHYTVVECIPLTGRKHQIRRHAKIAGHPILGDSRYGSNRSVHYLKEHCSFSRLALHAWKLSFRPKETEKEIIVCSSSFHTVFKNILNEDQ